MEVKAKEAGAELSLRQKKNWLGALFVAIVLIIGLVVAIVVVKTRENNESCIVCENAKEMADKEKRESELEEATSIYASTVNEITKIISRLEPDDIEGAIYTYQYYIDKTDNELAKAMLESLFLQVQMGYDIDNTKGDELIKKAQEIDEKIKTTDSAVLVMNLASNYGKTELYNEYEAILNEREKAEGVDMEMETKG